MGRLPSRMKSLRIKSLKMTERRSMISVMKLSSGWMLTNLLRLKSSATNRRRLKVCATPSSQSCTRPEEVCLVPQVVCLIWVLVLAVLQVLDPVQDQPSRRLINLLISTNLILIPSSFNHVGSKVEEELQCATITKY